VLKKAALPAWSLVGPFVIMAAGWEIIALFIDPQFFPPLYRVVGRILHAFMGDPGWSHTIATVRKMFLAFGIGTVAGVIAGLVIGWFRLADAFFSPLISFTYALPRVALIPLFILWLGIGETTIVFAASIAVFYIVLINTIVGVKNTDRLLIRAAKNLGANGWQTLMRVLLPSSAVIIFSAVRLGIGQALISVVSGEILIGNAGLGYWIWSARYNLDTPLVFVILILLGVLGYAVTHGAEALERRLLVWQVSAKESGYET
jgi:ABC-type nitrate/sulfonate/bicarbonate transport system permease component